MMCPSRPVASTRHLLQLTSTVGHYASTADRRPPESLGARTTATRLTASQQRLRDEFLRQEADREAAVDHGRLTAAEELIHRCHAEAVGRFHFTYDDPATGLRVMTRYRHFLRGSCCGSACRHCIYRHENVVGGGPADTNAKEHRKVFNTSFWVDPPPPTNEEPDEG
jgi:hypothetical protein